MNAVSLRQQAWFSAWPGFGELLRARGRSRTECRGGGRNYCQRLMEACRAGEETRSSRLNHRHQREEARTLRTTRATSESIIRSQHVMPAEHTLGTKRHNQLPNPIRWGVPR